MVDGNGNDEHPQADDARDYATLAAGLYHEIPLLSRTIGELRGDLGALGREVRALRSDLPGLVGQALGMAELETRRASSMRAREHRVTFWWTIPGYVIGGVIALALTALATHLVWH